MGKKRKPRKPKQRKTGAASTPAAPSPPTASPPSRLYLVALLGLLVVGVACVWITFGTPGEARLLGYRTVATYPHDPKAFCQGLIWHDGALYEGTGRYGKSRLRRVALETGEVEKESVLPGNLFGEGITRFDGKIYQLTYQENRMLAWEETGDGFRQVGSFEYPREGWGLTHDGTHLIASDGSDLLYFLDPATMETVRELEVRDGDTVVDNLNELEFIQGEIYANVWTRDWIARISPESGELLGWIDLTGLRREAWSPTMEVLNGIAYDKDGDRLFVTGKNWSKLFEIELVKK